jgi:hypothetical protein
VLNIRHANALGATTSGTTVLSGGTLEIESGMITAAEPLTLNGFGNAGLGALDNVGGNNTWGSAVALASDSAIGSDADTLTIPSLTGAFAFVKSVQAQ